MPGTGPLIPGRAAASCGQHLPLRARHTSFMQTSKTYMIGWRARTHQ
jgi:hypothetical protein